MPGPIGPIGGGGSSFGNDSGGVVGGAGGPLGLAGFAGAPRVGQPFTALTGPGADARDPQWDQALHDTSHVGPGAFQMLGHLLLGQGGAPPAPGASPGGGGGGMRAAPLHILGQGLMRGSPPGGTPPAGPGAGGGAASGGQPRPIGQLLNGNLTAEQISQIVAQNPGTVANNPTPGNLPYPGYRPQGGGNNWPSQSLGQFTSNQLNNPAPGAAPVPGQPQYGGPSMPPAGVQPAPATGGNPGRVPAPATGGAPKGGQTGAPPGPPTNQAPPGQPAAPVPNSAASGSVTGIGGEAAAAAAGGAAAPPPAVGVGPRGPAWAGGAGGARAPLTDSIVPIETNLGPRAPHLGPPSEAPPDWLAGPGQRPRPMPGNSPFTQQGGRVGFTPDVVMPVNELTGASTPSRTYPAEFPWQPGTGQMPATRIPPGAEPTGFTWPTGKNGPLDISIPQDPPGRGGQGLLGRFLGLFGGGQDPTVITPAGAGAGGGRVPAAGAGGVPPPTNTGGSWGNYARTGFGALGLAAGIHSMTQEPPQNSGGNDLLHNPFFGDPGPTGDPGPGQPAIHGGLLTGLAPTIGYGGYGAGTPPPGPSIPQNLGIAGNVSYGAGLPAGAWTGAPPLAQPPPAPGALPGQAALGGGGRPLSALASALGQASMGALPPGGNAFGAGQALGQAAGQQFGGQAPAGPQGIGGGYGPLFGIGGTYGGPGGVAAAAGDTLYSGAQGAAAAAPPAPPMPLGTWANYGGPGGLAAAAGDLSHLTGMGAAASVPPVPPIISANYGGTGGVADAAYDTQYTAGQGVASALNPAMPLGTWANYGGPGGVGAAAGDTQYMAGQGVGNVLHPPMPLGTWANYGGPGGVANAAYDTAYMAGQGALGGPRTWPRP